MENIEDVDTPESDLQANHGTRVELTEEDVRPLPETAR